MQYRFSRFALDPDNFELKTGNQVIKLRAKAFHVLAYLLKNRHRMVSKNELLDEVWHKQYIAESTLNSCIKTVRQALGDNGKNQEIIQTVRGQGYRLIAAVEMLRSSPPAQTPISRRLIERSDIGFVGREKEIQLIHESLSHAVRKYWVYYLYGSGGIGKTSILKKLCRSQIENSTTVYIDCREFEPIAQKFLQSFGEMLCDKFGMSQQEEYTLDSLSIMLSNIGKRVLLCIDQFENFVVLDSWMRQSFFPALPDSVLTVIASRQKPKTAWYTGSEWCNAFEMIEIGELSEDETNKMLSTRQLDEQQIQQVRRFAKGYPLALELAAMVLRKQPNFTFSESATPLEVVTQLTSRVVSDLNDVEKEAVEALSLVNRANEPILCALLGLKDSQKLFLKLRDLPFISTSTRGICLHDVVRDAVSQDLTIRDPDRANQYRINALQYFVNESLRSRHHHLWQLTADLLFLIEKPIIREAYFPMGSSEYSIQSANQQDHDAIIALSEQFEPPAATHYLKPWLNRHSNNFLVAKSTDDSVAGFELFFDPKLADAELLEQDPITRSWLQHLEDNSVRTGEKVLFYRRFLAQNYGDAASPVQGAFWVDIKRVYMEMRPHLRRLYIAVNHLEDYEAVMQSVGFVNLKQCRIEIEGLTFHTIMCDFGEHSIDGWLLDLVKTQLGINNETSMR